jgi:hypothetical protein
VSSTDCGEGLEYYSLPFPFFFPFFFFFVPFFLLLAFSVLFFSLSLLLSLLFFLAFFSLCLVSLLGSGYGVVRYIVELLSHDIYQGLQGLDAGIPLESPSMTVHGAVSVLVLSSISLTAAS